MDLAHHTVGRNALITFVTAGYPSLEKSVGILKAMQEGGADIIELGSCKAA
jgi:tryptophan synthase